MYSVVHLPTHCVAEFPVQNEALDATDFRQMQTNLFGKWAFGDPTHGLPDEKIPVNKNQLAFVMKLTQH